jgi:hypothetical protein
MTDKEKPGRLIRGKNLITSLAQAGKHYLDTGEIRVDAEEFHDRIVICESNDCGYFAVEADEPMCNNCGCYLNIKAWGAGFTCPLRLWPGDLEKVIGEDSE